MHGYKRGYDKGKADAADDQPRDPKPPIVAAVLSERLLKEYGEGYKRGFDDEQQSKK